MGITYQIDAEAGVIFSFAEGEIGVADFRASVNQFMADPLYTPKLRHLFDARSAAFSYSADEVRELASLNKTSRPGAQTAFVINKESKLTHGLVRMYFVWRDGNHKIFHDMASAREWLGLPPEGS